MSHEASGEGSREGSGEPSGVPREEADRWQQVAPQSVTAERIAGWIFAAVVLVAGAVAILSFLLLSSPSPVLLGLVLAAYGLLAAVLIWAAHWHPALNYRHTFYQLSDAGFEIRRGILWRRRITVPHARVQHTDVAQGPLERSFDIGKLIVYTAGTQNASVELGGLAFTTACELRDALIGRREASDGV
ncbi:PH domain-containing protein [Candidatus Laterigemmans baculatus]|uniref:PH domain-containing protein n=1 Tax=Candidatus Laterigemmans baculatus TaxID=2770505 RepID=UPI0013D95990|nr:PH domain-containing protein [Candidatus Laterigemmans baculatus]